MKRFELGNEGLLPAADRMVAAPPPAVQNRLGTLGGQLHGQLVTTAALDDREPDEHAFLNFCATLDLDIQRKQHQ